MIHSGSFNTPAQEHPFAQYVRILGKGKSGSRSLSREEAHDAFSMILREEVEPIQLGAFLMLLRVKEETGDEVAGFVEACRDTMLAPPAGLQADLDWSSYAGKKHQHPWYILSMLLLAQAGYRVFVHGCDGHTAGRLYTEQTMRQLALPVANDWGEVQSQLQARGLSYLPLRHFCGPLHNMLQLRPLLGLRSPVNTLARMLNPLRASCSIQSIFHPAYGTLHQQADALMGQPRAMVFKGDSGEIEIKPHADTRLQLLSDGISTEQIFGRSLAEKQPPVHSPAIEPLRDLWRGDCIGEGKVDREQHYGLEALLGTTAAALLTLQAKLSVQQAQAQALDLWKKRDRMELK